MLEQKRKHAENDTSKDRSKITWNTENRETTEMWREWRCWAMKNSRHMWPCKAFNKRRSHTQAYLCCGSAHVSHHPARHARLKDVGGGKVIHLLQRHLTQGRIKQGIYVQRKVSEVRGWLRVGQCELLYVRGFLRVILWKYWKTFELITLEELRLDLYHFIP